MRKQTNAKDRVYKTILIDDVYFLEHLPEVSREQVCKIRSALCFSLATFALILSPVSRILSHDILFIDQKPGNIRNLSPQ